MRRPAARCFLRSVSALTVAAVLLGASPAFAYRPFEGTDAEVAEEGEFELELGPMEYQRLGQDKFLIVPATVLNFGLIPRWELVVDWRDFVKLSGSKDTPKAHFEESDIFLKVVLREGVLQDKTGLSIATEFGPLLPNYHYESGYGASDNLITSFRIPELTLHLNTGVALSRSHNLDITGSLIVEGPHDWAVRPVAEILLENERTGHETSAILAGAIWEASEHLAIDAAVRGAIMDGEKLEEIRAGLTWTTEMWGASSKKEEAWRRSSFSRAQ